MLAVLLMMVKTVDMVQAEGADVCKLDTVAMVVHMAVVVQVLMAEEPVVVQVQVKAVQILVVAVMAEATVTVPLEEPLLKAAVMVAMEEFGEVEAGAVYTAEAVEEGLLQFQLHQA